MSDQTGKQVDKGKRFRFWVMIPAFAAALFGVMAFQGLQRENVRDLPSTLIDRPVPEFALGPLNEGQPGLSKADLEQPGVKLLNIFASWCGPCREEHPILNALSKEGVIIHGLNYKDQPDAAKEFLAELGDPYTLIGSDTSGRAGIEWGVYGVPETFVIDGQGRVILKHIGPLSPRDVVEKIRPAIEAAEARAELVN